MKLQGRDLSMRMQGEDVKLLQQELRKLGFSIKDKAGSFGKSTQEAVLAFQKQHAIEESVWANKWGLVQVRERRRPAGNKS